MTNLSLFQHDERRVLTSRVIVDDVVMEAAKALDCPFTGVTEFHAYSKPIVPDDYGIGVIVGPSGSGKSTLLREFGDVENPEWDPDRAIASHFQTADEAIERFGAVGLNTVPAWLRPFHVLSTGQQFRANLARQLVAGTVIDEFTSVVDRTVAQAASRSLRRYVTAISLQRITLATCHYDVIEWLEPDWVFDCGSGQIEITRGLLRRPKIDITIHECGAAWSWHDPFGHSTRDEDGGIVIAAVPGRGLWGSDFGAPRLVLTATGDFAVQATVGPADDRPAVGGLLVWKSVRDYLRLDWGSIAPRNVSFRGCRDNSEVWIGRGRLRTKPVSCRARKQGYHRSLRRLLSDPEEIQRLPPGPDRPSRQSSRQSQPGRLRVRREGQGQERHLKNSIGSGVRVRLRK